MDAYLDMVYTNIGLIIGILGIIVGAIIAVYFYLISKKEKHPYYYKRSFNIINEGIKTYDLLKVTYANIVVDNFTVTKIAFWNSGNLAIRKDDLVDGGFTVKIDASKKILDASIIKRTSDDLKDKSEKPDAFTVSKVDDRTLKVSIDHLDIGEGFVIQLAHTGFNKDISLQCNILECNVEDVDNLAVTNKYFKTIDKILKYSF